MAYESESLIGGNGSPNDVASAANLISAGDWVTGALSSSGDVDYFKFTAAAGLLTLQFKSSLLSNTARWRADLLDANGDFLRTLTSSASGTLLAKQGTSDTQVIVSGLSGALTSGSQFTLNSSAADTTIYTVLSVDGRSGDTSTVTVDKAFTSTTNVSVLFDPAQMLATGSLTSLQALIPQNGTYYLKVSPLAWTDADYAVQVNVQASAETANNNSITDARDDNSRLLAGVTHQGTIDSATDADVWLLTTAKASTFTINFASDANSTKTKFHVNISVWTKDANGLDVLTPAQAAGGVALDSQVEGQLSFTIDSTKYPQTNTFVVKVTADSLSSGVATGGYTLKATGTGLDLNDNPVIQVGSYTSANPLDLLDLTLGDKVVHTYAKDAGQTIHKVALSSLFTASDADTSQTLSYKVWLAAAAGSSAVGTIKLEPASGTATVYANGTLMTAAQLQTAYVYTGSSLGDLKLKVMAFDSTNAPDNSGVSSQVQQTLRVVSDAVGVNVTTDSNLSLTEGAASSDATYQESIGFSLKTAPTADVQVNLLDSGNQFVLSARKLTFTSANYATEQTVTVRANNDGKVEGSNVPATLAFSVVSSDTSYDGNTITPLSITISDPSNHAPTGAATVPTTLVTQGTSFTVDTSTLADADTLGTLLYAWQRSVDNGAHWTDITGSATASYKPVLADAGNLLRVNVSYYDGLGKLETVTSNVTNAVIKTNSAPISVDAALLMAKTATHTFAAADFPFTDVDVGDALSAVVIYTLPAQGTLKFNGASFAVGDGYKILLSELSQLVYTPNTTQSGTYADTLSFAVVDKHDEVSAAKVLTLQISTPPTSANATLTGTEDTAAPIALSSFGFTDVDSTDAIQSVTITALPVAGQLRLGNDAVNVNQSISVADITANKLVFTPAANANGNAAASLKFKVFDGTVLSANDYTLTFNLTAVNDAPTGSLTISGTNTQGQTLTAVSTLADVDGLGTLSYQWKADGANITGATSATLTLAQAQVGKLITVVGSYTDVQGTAESVTSAATSAVANVNDAPTSADASLTGTEDTALSIPLSSFGFTDIDTGDTLASVKITALPAVGQLRLNGTDVTLNQVISAADIAANKLVFTPALNASGDAYANLKFKVSDGTALSVSDATLSIKINAVDDAPTFASVPANAQSHSAGVVFSLDDVTVADVDSTNLSLSVLATNGSVLGLTDADASKDGIQLSGTAAQINTALAKANFVGTAPGNAALALTLKDATSTTTASYPLAITAAASATDTDGDGVANSLEMGDANGDGIADQYQSNVASNAMLTLVAQSTQGVPPVDAQTQITGLTNGSSLGSLTPPAGMTEPGGVLAFNALVTSGKAEHFSLLVANSLAVNGYWQQNSAGAWVNLAVESNGGSITQVGNITRLDFVVTDGGALDGDHAVNGVIVDTGLVGHLTPSLVGMPTTLPDNDFWF
jgi:hypothetical protein